MRVEQVYKLVNTTVEEILGESVIVQEDLSNIVDVGKEIISSNNLDNYVKKLVNHIGKVVFDDRVYRGNVPSVLRDSWEYGSILEKITADIPEAIENESCQLSGNVHHQTRRQSPFTQRILLQVDAWCPLHHQNRLVTHPLKSDHTRHSGMIDLLEHERLLFKAILQRLGQIDPGKLEYIPLAVGGDAAKHETIGALADQRDVAIAQLLKLGLA